MITLNGKRFAENENEFLDSLFQAGTTCAGYARRLKRHIKLFDMQKNLVGVVTCHGVLAAATPVEGRPGRYWYNHADIDLIGRYERYSQCSEEIEALSTGYDFSGTERKYIFN
jgi:hypothetical protein